MKKLILISTFIFLLSLTASAQTADRQTVEECRTQLSESVQIANKYRELWLAEKQAKEAFKELADANEKTAIARKQEADAKQAVIETQDRLIARLEKKAQWKVSVLWGVIKFK